jgi:tetratricopeptide (TPR) repeat protein
MSLYHVTYTYADGNLLKETYKLIQEKDWNGAETKFLQYLTERPDDVKAKNDLAYVYYNTGKYQDALNLLDAILKGSGEDVLALFRRGLVFFKLGDYSRGLSDFQRVNTLSPQFGDGWTEFNMGAAYFKLEKWDMAIDYFQKAYQRNKKEFENYIYYYRNIGYSFFKAGRYNEAAYIYKQGLIRFPEDELLFEMTGWSLQKSGKKEESVEYLIKASEIGYKKLGSLQSAHLSLPFNGWWKVAQGNDEGYTHRGLGGKYSYDFVAVDEKGSYYSGERKKNEDHFCFGREILSPFNGIVDAIENNIPDNISGGYIYMPVLWGNYFCIFFIFR